MLATIALVLCWIYTSAGCAHIGPLVPHRTRDVRELPYHVVNTINGRVHPRTQMAFDYAIEYIERAIGRPVFIRDRSLDARVVVRVEKDMWPTHGKWHKGKRGTSVLLGSHLEARPAPWIVTIILHELGHVLGLEHTEDQDSVMRPHHNVDDIPDERHPMFFSKDEIELLRRMHGAKEHRSWM